MDSSVKLEELKEDANGSIMLKSLEENIDQSLTPEDFGDNAHIPGSVENLNDSLDKDVTIHDFNDNAAAYVSLNVIESELDMLNDDSTDEEKINNEMENDNVSVVSIESIPMKESKRKPKSQLHCAICNNYFENPKLLLCLHTFCLACLKKGMKTHYKYIFCHICRRKLKIPKGGIEKLTDNVVAASLIKDMSEKEQSCMICLLHNEVKACTGMCVDCGDTMCDDCCQKHTFSRLTAKHVVITLEQMENGQYTKPLQKDEILSCQKHLDKTVEYFCTVCCEGVCKVCAQSGHRSHKCDLLAGKKKLLKEKFDLFKQECESKLIDDTEESKHLISEHKKKELEKLKNAKDALIEIIEQKYAKCAENLQLEYNIKERKYCEHKKARLKYLCSEVENLAETILFMLNEGNDVQAAMLENTIMNAMEDKISQMRKVWPKLTQKSPFPEVRFFKEHAKVLEGLTFFSTYHIYREQKRADEEKRLAQSEIHVENGEIRMKLGQYLPAEINKEQANQHKPQSQYMMPDNRTQKTMMNSASCINNENLPPSLLSLDLSHLKPAAVGRGSILKVGPQIGIGSILKTDSENKSSLLGEYTGQCRHSLMEVISCVSPPLNNNSCTIKNKPENWGQNLMGKTILLDLSTSLDTSIIMDKKAPNNVDVVFMSPQNFAVADIKNQRLKIFNINGKLIKYIDDPSPMSVTFCANHLLWSSQFSFVKVRWIKLLTFS